jgi:hypothetical protein
VSEQNAEHVRAWAVSVNNGQKIYIVHSPTVGDACTDAGALWRNDQTVTGKQRRRGIYAISARLAKFGEVRDQPILSVQIDRSEAE